MNNVNVAICCIIKDTPEKYLKLFIDHHLKLGIKDIHFCLDETHTTLYDIDNPNVFFYNYSEVKEKSIDYIKYVNLHDPCQRLNIWYSYFLYTIGRNYNWVALIDDDEYLHMDILRLRDFSKYDALYLPWHFEFNSKIKETDPDCITTIPMSAWLINYTGGWCYKSIINISKLDTSEDAYGKLACHYGFNKGVDENKRIILGEGASVINLDNRIYPDFTAYTMYILHKKSTSFEEEVNRIFNRGDSAITKNTIDAKIATLKERYSLIWGSRCLKSLDNLLLQIGRIDVYNYLHKEDFNFKTLQFPNIGICCMVKDTEDYLIKEFIQHHLSIGISDIYIYIDLDSKPIYRHNNSRVHYYEITLDMNLEFRKLGFDKLIDSNKDLGVQRQVGGMNYMLEKHRLSNDWLAFIDDDEFLNVNFYNLYDFEDWDCVYIPWKCYYTTDIKCLNNVNNVKLLVDKDSNVSNRIDWNWLKSIVNTRRINEINHIHWGNYKGVMMDWSDFRWNAGNKFIIHSLQLHYLLNTNYIAHYQVRSFEEWVTKVVDRKDMLKRLWQGYYYGRSLKQYFIMLIECGEPITYCLAIVEKYLNLINRNDVLHSCEYDWAKITPITLEDTPVCVLYNINNELITDDDLTYYKNKYGQDYKYMIVDYDKGFTSGDLYYDKNTMIAWMCHIGLELNCWDEWWILMLTLRKLFSNVNPENIKLEHAKDRK